MSEPGPAARDSAAAAARKPAVAASRDSAAGAVRNPTVATARNPAAAAVRDSAAAAAGDSAAAALRDSAAAAALLAVDPVGLGGAVLRARPGPERDRFMALFRSLLPEGAPWRRAPANAGDDALLGGLDLAATLASSRPVRSAGLLEAVAGGALVLAMAERATRGTVARVTSAQETGEGFCVLALDEGLSDEEGVAPALLDRLAFVPDLSVPPAASAFAAADVARAARHLPRVASPEPLIEAILRTCAAAGIASLRAPALALRAARASAALHGRDAPDDEDAALAVRLVLAPRALVLPAPPEEAQPPPPERNEEQQPEKPDQSGPMEDVVQEAARAALPAQLLAALAAPALRLRASAAGKTGAARASQLRGRPVGSAPGDPRGGARLALLETLRAAAPWQRLRAPAPHARIAVRRADFRIKRFQQNAESTAIFVVDASGSSALHRLAEAKGAVELLLAECYARRDRVAVIAFRREGAEALLPPTHSLVRAKRALAGLPGGGTSPLAAGLDAALALLRAERRAGRSPVLVVLTDGRANVARDGRTGRAAAEADALLVARQLRAEAAPVLVVDTSPRPQPFSADLAREAGGRCLPLPHARAEALAGAVKAMV